MLLINDIHIGFRRVGGTTPASQEFLRSYLLGSFERLLAESKEDHVVILGDLFDDFEVDKRDILACYNVLSNHLDNGAPLILIAGNHDWSPKGDKLSSRQALTLIRDLRRSELRNARGWRQTINYYDDVRVRFSRKKGK